MHQIPNDTKLEILTHLDYETIISIAKTSKTLAAIARNDFLWKRKLEEFKYTNKYDDKLSYKQIYISKVRPLILIKKHIKGSALLPHVLAFKYQQQYKRNFFFYPDEQLIILKSTYEIYLVVYSSQIPLSPNGYLNLPLISHNPVTIKLSASYIEASLNTIDLLLEQSVITHPAEIILQNTNWYGTTSTISKCNDNFTWYLTTIDDFMNFACRM